MLNPKQQLLRWASKGTSSPQTSSSTSYDAESGQFFKETQVVFKRAQHSDWIGEFKTPKVKKVAHPNSTGSRSLFDTAKIKTAREVRNLNADHFSEIPWPTAEKIWDEIVFSRGESFHAWRTFAAAYTDNFNTPERRYQLHLKRPSLPLPDYFSGISSSNLSWLTSLRISPKQITSTDLVAIAKIKNLAVLDLSDGQVTIDDLSSAFTERILRTWAELASIEDSFQSLRVLLLGWQEHVSDWIFKYLDRFASLSMLIITDCPHLHQRNRIEWEPMASKAGFEARHAKKSAKSLRPLLDDKAFYVGAVSRCYYASLDPPSQVTSRVEPQSAYQPSPVLECWIGTPRPWLHIIDEFPSTRTVWFDRLPKHLRSQTKVPDAQDYVKGEPVKRIRDVDPMTSTHMRSPPPKRIQAKLKSTKMMRSASDILADLTNP